MNWLDKDENDFMMQGDIPPEIHGFGCAMFDGFDGSENYRPEKGWASINGESAQRFQSIKDLSSRVVWITNLDQKTFWKTGLVRIVKLKESHFFETDLAQIIKECGLNPKKTSTAKMCEILSEIYTRSMNTIASNINKEIVWLDSVKETLKKQNKYTEKTLDAEVEDALMRSYSEKITCPKSEEKFKVITFRKNRVKHAKNMLTNPFPKEDWEVVDLSVIHGIEDWLENEESPLLIKFKLRSWKDDAPEELRKIFEIGQCTRSVGRKRERDWLTKEEWMEYKKFINFKIEGALKSSGWESVIFPFHEGELSEWSLSLGLIAEAQWKSFMEKEYHQEKKIKSRVSPRAAWINARDRLECFKAAKELIKNGIEVESYGNGEVDVRVKQDTLEKIVIPCDRAELEIPSMLLEMIPVQNFNEASILFKIAHKIKKNHEKMLWLSLDRLFYAEQEKDAIEKLKEAGRVLNAFKEDLQNEEKDWWSLSLTKQLRDAVERAKKIRKEKELI